VNRAFINGLHAIIRILAQFSDASPSGALKWDGQAYTSTTAGPSDVLAAKWWGILTALAGLLDAQAAPITIEQRRYLDRLLFGGMGSLNDLVLDERRLGPQAVAANRDLDRRRKELFDALRLT
jgi:hypothetical protein